MFSILICEDNKLELEQNRQLIEECINEQSLNFKVELSTTQSIDIINYFDKTIEQCAVFFLDVELKDQLYNGISLARLIQEKNCLNHIVFITSHAEAGALTYEYEIECVDFILKASKQKMKKRINKSLSRISQDILENKDREAIFMYNNQILNANRIFYIETSSSNAHNIIIYYEKELSSFRGILTELMIYLPPHFYRCHRSVIVNLKKIDYINIDERIIYMINGNTCEGSIKLLNKLKQIDYRYFSK